MVKKTKTQMVEEIVSGLPMTEDVRQATITDCVRFNSHSTIEKVYEYFKSISKTYMMDTSKFCLEMLQQGFKIN